MGFKGTYAKIEKLWGKRFESLASTREKNYFGTAIHALKGFFESKCYKDAAEVAIGLYQHFERKIRVIKPKRGSIEMASLAMASYFYDLESILTDK